MVIIKLTKADFFDTTNIAADNSPEILLLNKLRLKINEVIDEVNP